MQALMSQQMLLVARAVAAIRRFTGERAGSGVGDHMPLQMLVTAESSVAIWLRAREFALHDQYPR